MPALFQSLALLSGTYVVAVTGIWLYIVDPANKVGSQAEVGTWWGAYDVPPRKGDTHSFFKRSGIY